jgi:hypothetical protein
MSMSSAATLERIAEISPLAKGRIAGVFEALEGFSSSYGQVVILGKLVVAGDAAATAANILGHERQMWFGSSGSPQPDHQLGNFARTLSYVAEVFSCFLW